MHYPERTTRHFHCGRHHRNVPATCTHQATPQRSFRFLAYQRRRAVCVAASKTLYETLGIGQDATDRDVKRAYRQKALKLHPDVNKAPNAQAQFLEVKSAFQVLSDPQQRAQYDRKLKGFGDFGSWGSTGGFGDFGSWGSSSSSSRGGRPKQQGEEEFYGLGDLLSEVGGSLGAWVQQQQQELSKLQQGASELPGWLGGVVQQAGEAVKAGKIEDFFNDLEKEVDSWSKTRSSSGKPASLWEELAAIGEELVDFLEQGLKEDGSSSSSSGAGKEGSSSGGSSSFNSAAGSSSSRSSSKSPVDAYEELKRQYDLGGNSNGGPSSSSSSSSSGAHSAPPPPPPPPPPKKSADEEIDDMLAALKRKMNKS